MKKAFSLLEIIITLAFSGIILTSFIGLSAWSLNKAKDNETEDLAYQALIEMNDLLRSSGNVSIGEDENTPLPSYGGLHFYTIRNGLPGKRCNLSPQALPPNSQLTGSVFDDYSSTGARTILELCKSNTSMQAQFNAESGVTESGNVICAIAKISKISPVLSDKKYTYVVRVIAEKSDDQIFDEVIEGIKTTPFYDGDFNSNHDECN